MRYLTDYQALGPITLLSVGTQRLYDLRLIIQILKHLVLPISIGVPEIRVLHIRQIPKSHQRPLLLGRRHKSLLCQIPYLDPVAPAQVAREEQEDNDLDAVGNHDSNDARGVAGRFGGLESEGPDDVADAIRDEEDGVNSCTFS